MASLHHQHVQQLGRALTHARDAASQHLLVAAPAPADWSGQADLTSAVQEVQGALSLFRATKASDLPQDQADELWQQGCQLWDVCVQANHRGLCQAALPTAAPTATLRQLVCQALALLDDLHLTEEAHISRLRMCLVAGQAWAALQRWEQAELLLALATSHGGVFEDLARDPATPADAAEAYLLLLFDTAMSRLQASWKLRQRELSSKQTSACLDLADALLQRRPGQLQLHLQLAAALQQHAIGALAADLDEPSVQRLLAELNEACKLIARVQAAVGAGAGGGAGQAPAGPAPPPGAEQLRPAAAELQAKVLLTLAFCHTTHTGKLEDGLRCIAALRQLDPGGAAGAAPAGNPVTALAAHPSVSLLALKAYVALQDLEHAEAEVTGLAVHDDADPDTCLAAVLDLVSARVPADRLQPVIELVQGRFPDNGRVLTTVVAALLQASAASPDADDLSTQYEQLALQLLDRCEPAGDQFQHNPALKQELFAAASAAAATLFQRKAFQRAVALCSAALPLAEDAQDKYEACRLLALCHMGRQDLARTLEHAELAESHLPLQAAASFIRFKAHLLLKDPAACTREMQHLCRCKDFHADLLKVAAQESLGAGDTSVAKSALLSLHALLMGADTNTSTSTTPTTGDAPQIATAESKVLRAVVKLLQDELEAAMTSCKAAAAAAAPDPVHDAGPSSDAQAAAVTSELLKDLGRLLTTVLGRMAALGLQRFTGCGSEQEAQQELEYYATVAWNAGLAAAGLTNYQAATVLMNHCAQLLQHAPAQAADVLVRQQMAFVLAGSAALEVHLQMPEHHASLALAGKMLAASDRPRKQLDALQPGAARAPGQARLYVYCCCQEFVLAARLQDKEGKAAALDRLRAAPACTAEHLLKISMHCQEPGVSDPETAAAAARLALQRLLSAAEPDYQKVALTLRMTLQLMSRDGDKLMLLQEVSQVLVGLAPGAYPDREVEWLVSTCWTKGLQHQRLARHQLALQFMRVALDLLGGCPSLHHNQAAMTAELGRQEAMTAAAPGAASPGRKGAA